MVSTDLTILHAPAMPTVERLGSRMRPYESNSGTLTAPDLYGVPRATLEAARAELTEALEPAGYDAGLALAKLLTGPFQKRDVNDPKIYAAILADILGSAPMDLAKQAVQHLFRTCTFMPAVAEVAKALDQMVRKRRMMLDAVRKELLRHEPKDRSGTAYLQQRLDAREGKPTPPPSRLDTQARETSDPKALSAILKAHGGFRDRPLGETVRNRSEAQDGI